MSFETDLVALLNPLVANNVYFDVTPDGYVVPAAGVIIMQQVGGKAEWYVDQTDDKSHLNARIQITSFKFGRVAAATLARLIEDTIRDSSFTAEPFGAAVGLYDEALKLAGSRQDFGFWYPAL